MAMQCGFIGCGNMGGALAGAVRKGQADLVLKLADRNVEKTRLLAEEISGQVSDVQAVASECDVIFLGVKPQGMKDLFEEIRPVLQQRRFPPVLITMAAGISIATIETFSGIVCPVIRIMPNTPVCLGKGMIVLAGNDLVTEQQQEQILKMLSPAGKLDVIAEEQIDAACALSGCGPAFVYLFAEYLAEGAVNCGVPSDKAVIYAAQTLLGAASMMLEKEQSPEQLRKAVCSPGGSTLAGLTALETEAFHDSVQEAVKRAYKRSQELGKLS